MTLKIDQDIEIKDSPIIGKGVFAKRLIKQGETIFEWKPKVLTKEQAKKLPKDELDHYTYPEGDKILWMQPPERHMNHSCDSNTEVNERSDVAIRDIKLGEEITSNYINVETENFECRCGAASCVSKRK